MKIRLFVESRINDKTVSDSGQTGKIRAWFWGDRKVRLHSVLFLNVGAPFATEF